MPCARISVRSNPLCGPAFLCTIALRISYRFHVMGHGHFVFEATPADHNHEATIRRECGTHGN